MDFILNRRSIRQYTKEPVSDAMVTDLLRAAMSAPSAGNQQPWQFIVLTERRLLDEIPKIHPFSQMLKEAPLGILVCADLTKLKYPEEYWIQDCSAATENILLAAHALGLGAVWLGIYPLPARVEGLGKLLKLPDKVIPIAMVSIGHPAESKSPGDRYNPERIHVDGW